MRLTKLLEKHSAGYTQIEVKDISFDPAFRAACEQNACGFYGACWMCPPDVGEIASLIARAKSFEHAIVFQTVHEIVDSFDIEGMHRAAKAHNHLISRLRRAAGMAGMAAKAGMAGVWRSRRRASPTWRFP